MFVATSAALARSAGDLRNQDDDHRRCIVREHDRYVGKEGPMIRNTLPQTKEATWAVHARPDPAGPPRPLGTAFAIHPAGFFLTAHHVVVDDQFGSLPIESLMRPSASPLDPMAMISGVSIAALWPSFDLALLQTDFDLNADKEWLTGRTAFPFIPTSVDPADDGTPVYSYGFPLSPRVETVDIGMAVIAAVALAPRATSAIIASSLRQVGGFNTSGEPSVYVVDKAFNYGNSGGPLVLQETGAAIGVAIEFVPVGIRQGQLLTSPTVWVPSLYGVASAVSNVAADLTSMLPAIPSPPHS